MTNHKPLPWGGVGVGLLLLSLSSCGLYNKYDRPDVVTDDIVRDPVAQNGALQSTDTTSFGNLPWRELFTDPQLRLLIEQGLEKNPDLLNAALNVQMVNEALKCARLAFLPSIALTPQGTISKLMTDPAVTTKSYQLPISASWNVDLFGNLLNAKRSAQMQLIATKDYQTVVQCNIISGIANLYYTLLMLDRQVEIVNDMEQLTKETWEMMKFMHENRVGYRSTAVQSAEAAYYSVQAQKVDLLRQTRETENALSLLIAQPAQTIQRGKLADQSPNALVSYNSSAEKGELESKRVAVLKQNVEDTKKLMSSSSNTTYLEVISAQSNLLNAEISEVTDQFNKMQAVVNLYLALGGGAR